MSVLHDKVWDDLCNSDKTAFPVSHPLEERAVCAGADLLSPMLSSITPRALGVWHRPSLFPGSLWLTLPWRRDVRRL